MPASGLTDQVRLTPRQFSSRNGTPVDTFLIHHQAGTNDDQVIAAMASGARQVSSNYTISNEGRLTLVVDESNRAWTSGSASDGGKGAAWDRRSITVEIENAAYGGDWPISQAALQRAAQLLQDVRARYNIRQVLGHRDLWNVYRASYGTFCPGPNTVENVLRLAGGGSIVIPAGSVAPVASVNYAFGLTTAAQLAVQKALAKAGLYSGIQDGIFGALSVRAFQSYLKNVGLLPGDYTVDGVPGPIYGKAVQALAAKHGYTGPQDGVPGAATSAAVVAWALTMTPDVSTPTAPTPNDPGVRWAFNPPDPGTQARIQRALKARGRYSGPVDGVWGPNTIKGIQKTAANVGYSGAIDGVPGPSTCHYVQVYAQRYGSYLGPIDSVLGPNSWAGFALGLERP